MSKKPKAPPDGLEPIVPDPLHISTARNDWRSLHLALAWVKCRQAKAVDDLEATPGFRFKFEQLFTDLPDADPSSMIYDPCRAWELLAGKITDGRVAILAGRLKLAPWVDAELGTHGVTYAEDLEPTQIEFPATRGYQLKTRGDVPDGSLWLGRGRYGWHFTDVVVNWPALVREFPIERGEPKKRGAKGYGDQMWDEVERVYRNKLDECGLPNVGHTDVGWRRASQAETFVIENA